MQQFEYRCVSIWGQAGRTTRILNELARDGWELVALWWVWHYFKRPRGSRGN